MILKEIKDVRLGQIWECKDLKYLIRNQNYREIDYSVFYQDIKGVPTTVEEFLAYAEGLNEENATLERGMLIKVEDKEILENAKLVGYLGITHIVENSKLVEIPRNKFEVDDIVESLRYGLCSYSQAIITGTRPNSFVPTSNDWVVDVYCDGKKDKDRESLAITEEDLDDEKVGILGVTHEFVNEKLGEK
jgi:hypothetical protein